MTEPTYLLLKKMEKRPGMWTGENTLKSIVSFISGYSIATEDYDVDADFGISKKFHDWIAIRLGCYESTAGWANMILAYTIGMDPSKPNWENYDKEITEEYHRESIIKFYELLEQSRVKNL